MNIKQAVAEALHECPPACVAARGINDRVAHAESDMLLAAAILATPQMQAIARQAAIGAAVERDDEQTIRDVVVGWLGVQRESVYLRRDIDMMVMGVVMYRAAIAAALGEDA